MIKFIQSYIRYIFLFLFVLLVAFIFIFYKMEDKNKIILEDNKEEITEIKEEIIDEIIMVDVKGYVKNPGVYSLKLGSRVIDAINMAGGITKKGSTDFINLSKILSNESVINIPSKYSKPLENECNCSEVVITECKDSPIIESIDETSEKSTKSELININTASKEELMTVGGIGESKATSIIAYRESTKFNSIEEIKNVSGIGEALFSKIKDYITI